MKTKVDKTKSEDHIVRVFSTQTCPWCFKAKDFLKQNGVKFEDINVGEDREAAKEMVEKTGQMGVPVIDVDGEFIIGFDQQRLKEKLNLK